MGLDTPARKDPWPRCGCLPSRSRGTAPHCATEPSVRHFVASLRQTGKHLVQPAWEEITDEVVAPDANQVECTSLQEVLEEEHIEQVDILRIHVLGREFDALRSAEKFLRAGKVKALAISVSKESIGLEAMAQMLMRYGYILQLEGFANLDVQNIFRAQQNLPQSVQTMIARYPR